MKGITPVIAIILLLLMAVAAAGGFYIVYQNFASSGEESGSSQIQALGETSLSQLTIESVASGKVYVRNVGASEIDATKLSVYVENIPYPVNVSSVTIAENSRAVLKFTEVPECQNARCELKISGVATTSRSVEAQKLSCASDSGCAYGESCFSGICISTGVAYDDCGNGVCDEGEHAYACFSDCHPASLILFPVYMGVPGHLIDTNWNGTTYVFSENLTENIDEEWWLSAVVFESDGTGGALGDVSKWHNCLGNSRCSSSSDAWYAFFDGSEWSYPYNVSNNGTEYVSFSVMPLDFDGNGNGMMVWSTYDGGTGSNYFSYSEIANGVPSSWDYFENTETEDPPSFAYRPDGNGVAVFVNGTWEEDDNKVVMCTEWDGNSWGSFTELANYVNNDAFSPAISFDQNGNGLAFWVFGDGVNDDYWIHHASYDGSAWAYEGNFYRVTEDVSDFDNLYLAHDHHDYPLLLADFSVNPGGYTSYFTRTGNAWSGPLNFTGDPYLFVQPQRYGNTLFATTVDLENFFLQGEGEWTWTVWNGNGWTDRVMMNSRPV